ncbi:hypothetical protein [Arthrobacter sp. HLT1-21]
MTSSIARQPQGIPVGGQFAATSHPEPDLSLDASDQTALDPAVENLTAWATEQEDAMLDIQRGISNAGMSVVARTVRAKYPQAATLQTFLQTDDEATYLRVGSVEDANHQPLDREAAAFVDDLALEQGRIYMLRFAADPVDLKKFADWVPGKADPLDLAPPEDDLTPEQSSKKRMDTALTGWGDVDDDKQVQMRDLLIDLRHHADREDIDLHDALDRSYVYYLEEKNDDDFRNGY